jgi:hypothetical protein
LYWNYAKAGEGSDYQDDDVDLYALRAVLALPDFPIRPGLFVAYWDAGAYPTNAGFPSPFAGRPATASDPVTDAEFYWIGVNADGKIGPVALKTDFVYMDGEVEATGPGKTALIADADFSGFVFYADAQVPLDIGALPGFTVGGTFMYGSGDDLADTANPLDPEFDAYRVPPGSEANPTLGTVFWAGAVNDAIRMAHFGGRTSGTAVQQRYWGGLWTAKGYASFKPLDWMKVTGYAMYIGDTTDDGNTIGDAVDVTEPITGLQDDSDIGIEVGAIVDLSIYKNLTYSIAGGWLFAGDALDTATSVFPINDEPSDPWAIVSQLIYKF